jgi:hypothetical protein
VSMRVSPVDQLRDTGRRVEELDARLAEQAEAAPDRQAAPPPQRRVVLSPVLNFVSWSYSQEPEVNPATIQGFVLPADYLPSVLRIFPE